MGRPLRCALIIDAPEAAVRRSLRQVDVWTRTMRAVGQRLLPDHAWPLGGDPGGAAVADLRAGQLMSFTADSRRGARTAELRVEGFAGAADRSAEVAVTNGDRAPGDPGTGDSRALTPVMLLTLGAVQARIVLHTAATGAGTLTTVDFRVSAPVAAAPLARRRILRFGQLLMGILTVAARDPQLVVAGAVIRDGQVLAARRARPPHLAGLWEMPGGKLEPGEREQDALVRELREELGIGILVGERLQPAMIDLGDGLELRPFAATLTDGDPTPAEDDPAHDQVRWLTAGELAELPFLPGDKPMVNAVDELLTRG